MDTKSQTGKEIKYPATRQKDKKREEEEEEKKLNRVAGKEM